MALLDDLVNDTLAIADQFEDAAEYVITGREDPDYPAVQLDSLSSSTENPQFLPNRPFVFPGTYRSGSRWLGGAPFPGGQGAPQPGSNIIAPPAPAAPINDPWHVAEPITGVAGAAVVGQSQLILPRNSVKRNLLGFRNTAAAGGANVFIDFGQPAQANSFLKLTPGQTMLFDEVVPQSDIWAQGDANNWALTFIYSTVPVNMPA